MSAGPPGPYNPDGFPSKSTTADIRDPSARWRWSVEHDRWHIACLDRMCVFCLCGRSIELQREEDDDGGYDLIA